MKPSGSEPETAMDSEQVRLVRAGSPDAFDTLVRKYQGRICAYIHSRLRDRMEAEDLCQHVFVKAFRRLERYDEKRSFPAWLYGIARHEVLTAVRRRGPEMPTSKEAVEVSNPAGELMAADDLARLWLLARHNLPERQFSALWLVYREDLSLAEAARVLRVSAPHMKVLLHRGRRRLLERLDPSRQGRLALGTTAAASSEMNSFHPSPREVSP